MEKPSYYIILPAEVRYDKRLKFSEKILYGEIATLIHHKGFCYASNSFFASLYETHENTISLWIASLVKYGYLKTNYRVYESQGKKRQERRIYLTEKVEDTQQNHLIPLNVNCEKNNTSRLLQDDYILHTNLLEQDKSDNLDEILKNNLDTQEEIPELFNTKEIFGKK